MKIYKKVSIEEEENKKHIWCRKHFSDILAIVDEKNWKSISKIINDFQISHTNSDHARDFICLGTIGILSPQKAVDEICYGISHLVENGMLIEEELYL